MALLLLQGSDSRRRENGDSLKKFQGVGKDLTYQLAEANRKVVQRELAVYLEALCHDYQYSIRQACRLLEILALPGRLHREMQLEQLNLELGVLRDRQGWGRPWTISQLRRAFYARAADFRRVPPKPVTREELARYIPLVPPARRAKKGAPQTAASSPSTHPG